MPVWADPAAGAGAFARGRARTTFVSTIPVYRASWQRQHAIAPAPARAQRTGAVRPQAEQTAVKAQQELGVQTSFASAYAAQWNRLTDLPEQVRAALPKPPARRAQVKLITGAITPSGAPPRRRGGAAVPAPILPAALDP